MKVVCLSLEKGVLMGVRFSPVLREGVWGGEGETCDERALTRFRLLEGQFVLEPDGGGAPLPLTPTPLPQLPAPSPDVPPVQETAPVKTGVFPEGFPDEAVESLTAAGWTLDDVRAASDAQLQALPNIGKGRVKAIREALA